MTLPDRFVDQDKPERMYAQSGLHAAAIAEKVMSVLDVVQSVSPRLPARGALVVNR